jgi:phosphatidylserine/phosphatidylglycerophosphate/cardiolipin synthase-like enzyme
MKMVLCGDNTAARGFTSGIDFQSGRVDSRLHPSSATHGWHDVGAKVEGAAVDAMYRYFQLFWNEQIGRKAERFRFGDQQTATHVDETPEVPDRTFLAVSGGTHRVQVLRTAPQMHLPLLSTPTIPAPCIARVVLGFSRPPLSFAPDGIFEFRAALKKAIAAAEQYIYVEDQAFTGREIMEWIRDRLIAKPNLKVIFFHRADPTDSPENTVLLNMAINEHLVTGVPNVTARVAFYIRTDHVVVHSKTWIIDDELVIIGSANAMRRSLYTDGELSVGVLDENEGPGSFPVVCRSDLWAEYCGVNDAAGKAQFNDIDLAIRIWDPTWSISGAAGAAPGGLLPSIVRKRVPFAAGAAPDEWPLGVKLPATPEEREKYDTNYDRLDGDSRSEF